MSLSDVRPEPLHPVAHRAHSRETDRSIIGSQLLLCNAGLMISFGAFYVLLAATVVLLPSDTSYLGMSTSHLCSFDECRFLDFLAHGRMSYGGALVGVGVMTGWMALGPLRRGETWVWWTLLLAAAATYGSFLSYLFSANRYFDWSLGILAGIGVPLCVLGLGLTYRRSEHLSIADAFRVPGIGGWLRTRRGRARLIIAALGAGIGLAGFSILMIASTVLFVPQDMTFLDTDLDGVSAVSNQLAPLMAHDRAAYGGSMVALAVLFAATALRGIGPVEKGGKRALLIAGLAFYGSTMAIHFAIGYTNFVHLLPVYGGLACLLISLWFLADDRGAVPSVGDSSA
jgi:hypothetical protein